MIEQLLKPAVQTAKRFPTLLAEAGRLLGQFGMGKVQNLSLLRDNAMILSSALLVSGRIGIAKNTARKSVGTSEGPYRRREFYKTALREVGGFALSYALLRGVQLAATVGLKRYLGVSAMAKAGHNPFPGVVKTLKGLGRMTAEFLTGNPITPTRAIPIEQRIQWGELMGQLVANPAKAPRVKALEPLINGVHKLFGGAAHAPTTDKVASFIKWAPMLASVVPTIALSGFWLESFSLRRAKQMAKQTLSVGTTTATKQTDAWPTNPVLEQGGGGDIYQLMGRPRISFANRPYPAAMNTIAAPTAPSVLSPVTFTANPMPTNRVTIPAMARPMAMNPNPVNPFANRAW